jgi:deoxyribose-phosphate aldolase
MTDQIDELATAIAEKALLRLRAERSGQLEPTCGTAIEQPKDCAPDGCAPCPENLSCGARAMADAGASRVTPASIRSSKDLAGLIDHTLLKPDATHEDIVKVCEEARRYGFATVCVNLANVAVAARLLSGCPTVPIAVVGFPLGVGTTAAKVFETREAIRAGAREIDMVINIGALKGKDHGSVLRDIQAVVEAARPAPVKVILETGALSRDEKVIGCALAKAAGAAFVKTSTGFGPGGATAEDIALMRQVVGNDMGVKASGGIRSTADAQRMVEAGATRIGASASVAIVTGTGPGAGRY